MICLHEFDGIEVEKYDGYYGVILLNIIDLTLSAGGRWCHDGDDDDVCNNRNAKSWRSVCCVTKLKTKILILQHLKIGDFSSDADCMNAHKYCQR